MTTRDVDGPGIARRRMPAPVLAAAILLACVGGIAGAAGAIAGIEAGNPFTAGGSAAFACATVFGVVGLAKRWRGAQIFATVVGGLATLSGFTTINEGGLVSLVAGAVLVLLVVVPISSREWFTR